MKTMIRRPFRSAAIIVGALLIGIAAVPLFAGADAVDKINAGDSSQCSLTAKAKATSSCAVSSAADLFIAALLGDAEAGAKVAAALASEANCDETDAKVAAKTDAVDAKVAKVVGDADVSACCADVAADVAVDAKVAKVVAKTDVPACCQDAPAETENAGD